jgi:hypothetical protein
MAGIDLTKYKKTPVDNSLIRNPTYNPDQTISLGRAGSIPNDMYNPNQYANKNTLDKLNAMNTLPEVNKNPTIQQSQRSQAAPGNTSNLGGVKDNSGTGVVNNIKQNPVLGGGITSSQLVEKPGNKSLSFTTENGGYGSISGNPRYFGYLGDNKPGTVSYIDSKTYSDTASKQAAHEVGMARLRAGLPYEGGANIGSGPTFSPDTSPSVPYADRQNPFLKDSLTDDIRNGRMQRWQANALVDLQGQKQRNELGRAQLGIEQQKIGADILGHQITAAAHAAPTLKDQVAFANYQRNLQKDNVDLQYKQNQAKLGALELSLKKSGQNAAALDNFSKMIQGIKDKEGPEGDFRTARTYGLSVGIDPRYIALSDPEVANLQQSSLQPQEKVQALIKLGYPQQIIPDIFE